jgi:hypothetical protein
MTFKLANLTQSKLIIGLILAAILLLGGAYTVQQKQAPAVSTATQDVYVSTIHDNVNQISSEVYRLTQNIPTDDTLKYQHTTDCENDLDKIRYQNLEAEQGYNTISAEHKDINVKYRAFLHEAANAIAISENGQKPDLTKFEQAKATLN